jgi:U4/U6.U5 tri-snRNP-associated protein 2
MKRSRTSTKRKIADDDTHPKEEAVKQQKTGEVNAEETHLAALPERSEPSLPEKPIENETYTACPYLDTVNRSMLNFDFEKKCSVSLLTTNIYCCLVCGKYYQGRTPNTHAYTHSLEEDHHVFINMNNRRIFCLPDDYEVFDASLLDIKVHAIAISFHSYVEAL